MKDGLKDMQPHTPERPATSRVWWTYAAVTATAVVLAAVVLCCSAGPTPADYRSRMRGVDVATAFKATTPDPSLLPTGPEWVTHIEEDLLPYWTSPAALGNPIGNFPTFRANDGSVIDPKHPPQELIGIAAGETWLLNRTGRQYTRTMSRQIFAYCVAYHMTGDERYLRYAHQGLDYLFTKMVDPDGVFYSWVENGAPGPENARQRISQDMAYAAMGPAMYYYLTRDSAVLLVIRRAGKYILDHYREGNALRWINEPFVDLEETNLPTQKELVAQLDQINGYMLLMTTTLEGTEKRAWLDDMVMLANTMKTDYYNQEQNQFWGRIDNVEYERLGQPHVDFGHTIKTLWMMLEIGLRFDQPGATEHHTWVFDRLSAFGLSPVVVSDVPTDAASAGTGGAAPDILVILDGAGVERLNMSTGLASMVDSFTKQKKTILVADAAKRSLPEISLQSATVLQAGDLARVMRQIVERAPRSPQALAKTTFPDTDEWAARYDAASRKAIQGVAWNPALDYDAVLALWNGYDDDVAARTAEFLTAAGRRLLVVGPCKETIAGLNGGSADVAATYADPIRLTTSAIVVAPSGIWPKLTNAQQADQPTWVETEEPARQQRLAWLTRQYASGRLLVAFGFDSLHLGQQPLFKRMRFASTDQASVIWFGSTGAEYTPSNAIFSDKNLITAKPLVGVDEAIGLLQRLIKSPS